MTVKKEGLLALVCCLVFLSTWVKATDELGMAWMKGVSLQDTTMTAAVGRLARRRVDLAVFPECCLNGYLVPAGERDWIRTLAARTAVFLGLRRLRERDAASSRAD